MRFHRQTISVAQAQQKLLNVTLPLSEDEVSIYEAYGRTIAKTLFASCDMPPFDRSPLDGYAIRAADTIGATVDTPVTFTVLETIAAGQVPQKKITLGTASRIMTGAMLPNGADAVIMFEQTVNPGEHSDTLGVKREMKQGENISRQGEEVAAGMCIVKAGERVNAGTLALLATFGFAQVPVVRKPRIGLLSTGSELVGVGEPLSPGKIRNSNTVMLSAMIAEAGGIPVLFERLPDDLTAAKTTIGHCMEQVDILITTGGVSVGDFDVIADFVAEPEVELLFNRIAMRPGSPTTAALYRSKLLLGLSGNPGACFVGFELLVRPLLRHLVGGGDDNDNDGMPVVHAQLTASYEKPCPYPRYIRGRLIERETTLYAIPDYNDKSGNLSTLKESECFIVIPAGGRGKQAGEVVEVLPHRASSWRREE